MDFDTFIQQYTLVTSGFQTLQVQNFEALFGLYNNPEYDPEAFLEFKLNLLPPSNLIKRIQHSKSFELEKIQILKAKKTISQYNALEIPKLFFKSSKNFISENIEITIAKFLKISRKSNYCFDIPFRLLQSLWLHIPSDVSIYSNINSGRYFEDIQEFTCFFLSTSFILKSDSETLVILNCSKSAIGFWTGKKSIEDQLKKGQHIAIGLLLKNQLLVLAPKQEVTLKIENYAMLIQWKIWLIIPEFIDLSKLPHNCLLQSYLDTQTPSDLKIEIFNHLSLQTKKEDLRFLKFLKGMGTSSIPNVEDEEGKVYSSYGFEISQETYLIPPFFCRCRREINKWSFFDINQLFDNAFICSQCFFTCEGSFSIFRRYSKFNYQDSTPMIKNFNPATMQKIKVSCDQKKVIALTAETRGFDSILIKRLLEKKFDRFKEFKYYEKQSLCYFVPVKTELLSGFSYTLSESETEIKGLTLEVKPYYKIKPSPYLQILKLPIKTTIKDLSLHFKFFHVSSITINDRMAKVKFKYPEELEEAIRKCSTNILGKKTVFAKCDNS